MAETPVEPAPADASVVAAPDDGGYRQMLDQGYTAPSGDGSANLMPNPCLGVSCSGHGRCEVVQGRQRQCVCDPGYHAEGVRCVANAQTPTSPCAGVSCSGHGRCMVSDGVAECVCDDGYHAVALGCLVDPPPPDPCTGVACSGHGRCTIESGAARCICDQGHVPQRLTCIPAGDPCEGLTCNGHGTCVAPFGKPYCVCDPGYHVLEDTPIACLPSAGTSCDGVTCDGRGSCKLNQALGGATGCQCRPGYVSYGMACVPEGRIYCRDAQNRLAKRGTKRCTARDDTIIEVCGDADGNGFVEWTFGVNCSGGTRCSQGCLNAKCPDQPCPMGTSCVTKAHDRPAGGCFVTCDCSNCGNCDSGSDWSTLQNHCGNPSGAPALTACKTPCPSPTQGCIPFSTTAICWQIEGCFSAPPVK